MIRPIHRALDLSKAFSPVAILFLFLLLSCGAKRTGGGVENAAGAPAGEHYVDTSQYAIRPTYKGWTGDTARALNNLRQQLEQILSAPGYRNVTTSVKVVLFDQNDVVHPVYAKNPSISVLPASVEKLFTSSSTIWALGSHYAFTTKLDLAPNAQQQSNQIVGNLYLRPSGDPTLRSNDLDLLAEQMRQKGITIVQGDIISDIGGEESLSPQAKQYLQRHNLPSSPTHDTVLNITQDMEQNGTAPSGDSTASTDDEDEQSEAGALSVYPNFAIDRNIVTVTVTGSSLGSAPSVTVYPPLSSVVVRNGGKTSAGSTAYTKTTGKGKRKRTKTYYRSGPMTLRVSSAGEATDAQQTISISGQIPARSTRRYSFVIRNVPMAMAAVMKWKLQQHGIQVTGQPRVDRSPANAVLKTVASKETSLLDLLTQMNKRSDNYLAESMFRKLSTIASVAATAPDERARTLMRSWLQVCNVDGSQCTFIDGSGLSKMNRTSANTVIDLLTAIRQQGLFEVFTHTMSIAGYDGTLRHRMIGTPAQYNAHGKTGTLNAVTALAGYVLTGDGQLAAYFITMQKFRNGPYGYKRDQDRIVAALAGFRYMDYQSEATIPTKNDSAIRAEYGNMRDFDSAQGE